jgi:predicted nucleic acid-binding protein
MAASHVPLDVIIADSTVLINFLETNRLDLLLKVFEGRLHITDIVRSETKHKARELSVALASGKIVEHTTDLERLAHLTKSFSSFDEGEASCLLLAKEQTWRIATDDGAARAYVTQQMGAAYVVSTFDILSAANSMGYLTKKQAISLVADMEANAHFQHTVSSYKTFISSLR